MIEESTLYNNNNRTTVRKSLIATRRLEYGTDSTTVISCS
jgi:hypothetical protein